MVTFCCLLLGYGSLCPKWHAAGLWLLFMMACVYFKLVLLPNQLRVMARPNMWMLVNWCRDRSIKEFANLELVSSKWPDIETITQCTTWLPCNLLISAIIPFESIFPIFIESYLANLSLYPGKSELPFLPSNTQVHCLLQFRLLLDLFLFIFSLIFSVVYNW